MTEATALLMIDMQEMYLPENQSRRDALGWPPIWRFDETVEECARLLTAARETGIPVIYTRAVGRPDAADRTPAMRRLLATLPPSQPHPPAEGPSPILAAVAPRPQEVVVDKPRWDAFYCTVLEPILSNLGTRRLIVAGLQTNVCVESTVRSAMMRNFEVAVPLDAVSTDGEDLHFNALNAMRVLYVEVAPWRELIAPDAPWDRAFTTPAYGRTGER
ncbi:MAG: cysteine hydrolase [Acidimicrobiaceae bacterium]|nr:cysteine hydrolase [Acidimicrobiaceae bacterium]